MPVGVGYCGVCPNANTTPNYDFVLGADGDTGKTAPVANPQFRCWRQCCQNAGMIDAQKIGTIGRIENTVGADFHARPRHMMETDAPEKAAPIANLDPPCISGSPAVNGPPPSGQHLQAIKQIFGCVASGYHSLAPPSSHISALPVMAR